MKKILFSAVLISCFLPVRAFSRKASSSTAVTSSLNPSQWGQSVTLVASVTANRGTPTGTVQFFDGSTLLGTATVSSAAASLTTSTLSLGTHSITASYSGDQNHSPSTSPVLSQVVNSTTSSEAPTATALSSSPDPSQAGEPVTLAASITTSSGTPTGTVQFFDGSASLGTATVNTAAASLITSTLSVGTHSITAAYSGDSTHSASSSPALVQTVNALISSTALSSSLNPSTAGQAVTFTANVASTSSGTPTGSVQFLDGTTVLANSTLATGIASLTTNVLSTGSHSMTATYSGDSTYSGSTSSILTQSVNPTLATQTVLTSSPNPSTVGQAVTFSATVTATSGTPTGSVQFSDGSTALGTGTLAGGGASVSVSSLSGGTHSITATYSGDSTYSGSTSGVVSQVVNGHSVSLGWAASTSANVAGYNVYRAMTSGGPFSKLNSAIVPSLTYADNTVQAGETYYYVCTTVDTNNDESAYSNEAQAIVPAP